MWATKSWRFSVSVGFFKAALAGLKKLPRSKAHLEQEIDLRFSMRSALFPLGRHDDWTDHVRQAELLAREINDNARLAGCYNYLASHHWIRGRHKESIKLGEEGLQLAESAGNFSVEITTKFHLGIPLLYTGQLERQVAYHREVAQRLSGRSALERHGLSSVPSVTARGFLTWGLSELGEFEEAKMWASQGEALAGRVRNDFSTAFIQACSGLTYLRKGELGIALQFLQMADALVRDADIQSIFSFVAASLGDAYLLSDRPDDALLILKEAVKPQSLNFSIVPAIYPLTALSEAYRVNGNIEKARSELLKAIELYRFLDMKFWQPKAEAILSKIT